MAPKTAPNPARTALIAEMRALIKQHPLTERDAFRLICDFIPETPEVAYSIGSHIHDAIQETYTVAELAQQDQAAVEGRTHGEPLEYFVDVDYNQVIAIAYERAFFNEETAAKYGTQHFAKDLNALRALVSYLRDAIDGERGDNIVLLHRPAQH